MPPDDNENGTGNGTEDGTEGAPNSLGWGTGLAVLLAIAAVVTGLILLVLAGDSLNLTEAKSGSKPVFRTETGGGQGSSERRYLTWDVRKRAETTFRPGGPNRDFGFEGRKMHGELTFSVPDNCADRRIHWEIRIDGDRARSGSLRWLRKYKVKTDFPLDGTPDSVAITMYWNGGDARCPSFSAEWKDARVDRLG
jgi:hypothetical protein